MYIKRITDVNLGVIKKVDIVPEFDGDGNPKPIVLVGENGSGKSTLVSNVVDSLFEIAGEGFSNVHHFDQSQGYSFYKIISALQIHTGEKYMFSYVGFDNEIDYVFKAGNLSIEQFKEECEFKGSIPEWDDKENMKHTIGAGKEKVEEIFKMNVICYMGPDRYEKPDWMGEAYYDDIRTHLFVEPKFNGKLQNPISMIEVGKNNLRWLLDVIADSRTDIDMINGELQTVHTNINNVLAMTSARRNIEKVMSLILGDDVYFGLNLRREAGARFNIIRKKDGSVFAPTLDSLSTGQLALFNVFATIIRYADNNDINKSIHLENIVGIVVIDEIELHLHAVLQKEILPKLLNLFPKVQFIITTHSPLFLLGMDDIYGSDGYDIFRMPDGLKITTEMFSEFDNAYNYFTETQKHHNCIIDAINKRQSKALIITEGSTDWKHIKAAYNSLRDNSTYKELFEGLDFELLEYEPENSKDEANLKIQMGNSALCSMCESFAKMPQQRKLIFIADCDDSKTKKRLSIQNQSFKRWGNNVYSLILPVPQSRVSTPGICIEHYYSDEEIRTQYKLEGIERRLFLGNEFDKRGISLDKVLFCERKDLCGEGSIHIIEGSDRERITRIDGGDETNYAMPKSLFANLILRKEKGFDKFDFSNFIKLFEVIKTILED